MADQGARESIMNAHGYAEVLADFIEGRAAPDPDDTQTAEECLHIAADIVDHDPELAGMIVSGGLKMCRLLPDQAHWRKSASIAAVFLGQKFGGSYPETMPLLDDDLRQLHEDFPEDPLVRSHWHSLITFRIASETEHAPDDAIRTLDRLKSMIGDVETVEDESAMHLAQALSMMALSFGAYGPERANAWGRELMALRDRFPENADVVARADDTAEIIQSSFAKAVDMQARRNSFLGRLKQVFGF